MSIVLENLTKRFGNQTVVKHVSLEIGDGELFVLLGASGSGKSTILRMIAGLSQCDEGRILIQGRDVTHLAPQPRGTGLVFQNYSIFRHMTLAENIEFGLKIRKTPAAERVKKRDELLDMVGLAGFGDRYSNQISGGQQQRVALARALAYEPSVLLLDEPLGALDVKIRAQLRRSLKEIQRRLRVTTLLVTHDQEEAYELGDRIGVMDRGVLLEVGPAEQLYTRPKTLYVASFLGAGTVLAGRAINGAAQFGHLSFPIPEEVPHEDGASVELLFRPEHVELSAQKPAADRPVLGEGVVVEQTFSGAMRRLRLRLPRLSGTRQVAPALSFGEEGLMIDTILPIQQSLSTGTLWASLRDWTILEQAPPRLLVIDSGEGDQNALHLARLVSEEMQAAVTLLALGHEKTDAELRERVARRAEQVGLSDFDSSPGSGELSQQVAALSSNALFDLAILQRKSGGPKSSLSQAVVSFISRADIPVMLAGTKTPSRISRILICTRAGEPGKSDIRIGGRLARHLRAEVTLLHITRPGVEVQSLVHRHLKQASTTLSSLEVKNEIRTGVNASPAAAIISEASAYDLTVIGGHGPRSRSVFGRDDVTLQVLSNSIQPVLVVPAEL